MAVQAEEEREFLGQDESSDSEIEIDHPDDRIRSSEENSNNKEPNNEEESEGRDESIVQSNLTHGSRVALDDRTRSQEKIKEIDNEMLKWITELHELMKAKGLEDSAAMLAKCAETIDRNEAEIEEVTKKIRKEGMNVNFNATGTPRKKNFNKIM